MLRGVVLCETFRLAPALEKFAEFGMVHFKKTTRKAHKFTRQIGDTLNAPPELFLVLCSTG